MTNDIELETHIREIHREENLIDQFAANNRIGSLTQCLAKIEDAARKANWRLQELKK